MDATRWLVVPGSSRTGSLNRKLAGVAAGLAARRGVHVDLFDLAALELPIYHADLEAASGVPAGALRLLDAIVAADAVLIVTPEYNGFPTPLVINAFDWLSRIGPQPPRPSGLQATANKPAALMSASPGALGGLRSMNTLRAYLQMAFQMIVVPQQFALSRANVAFDEQGALKDEKAMQSVETVVGALAALAAALKRPA